MNPAAAREMAERRADLCARLQAQRLEISSRLGLSAGPEGGFPRSATMRLITRRPEMLSRVLSIAISLFRSRSR